jgi:hypothetical protein
MKHNPGDSIRKINGKRRIAVALVAAVGFLVVAYFAISLVIGSGVRSVSAAALLEQPGDRVAAIMAYADASTHSLKDRNRAIWALGQFGDSRALPVLEKHYTGQPCEHDRALCQHELKKAIKLCRGGTNLSAFVWRRGSLRS